MDSVAGKGKANVRICPQALVGLIYETVPQKYGIGLCTCKFKQKFDNSIQEAILNALRELSHSEYRATLIEAYQESRKFEELKKISAVWLDKARKTGRRRKSEANAAAGGEAAELPGIATSSSSPSAGIFI